MSAFKGTRRVKSRGTADAASPATPAIPAERRPMKISPRALDGARPAWNAPAPLSREDIFRPAQPPQGVLPQGKGLAMDSGTVAVLDWAATLSTSNLMPGLYGEGVGFAGYPYLAELTQRPEYRRISETIANEMTRRWIKLRAKGDGDKSKKIGELQDAMDALDVQGLFRKVAEHDGFFGIGHVYVDTGSTGPELATPLLADAKKLRKGGLRGLRVVDPMWAYPAAYNANDPLHPDYYRPNAWYVMGQQVHETRLLSFVSRSVPDILKPAYAFGGLSLSQMVKPYVDNWLRTRQSVSDLLHSFSTSGILTNLADTLSGGSGAEMDARAMLLTKYRDNSNTLLLDKETEEFFNISTPLSTVDALQAQAQEQMASVAGIPLVKLLGITPSGLNASSDGEIRVFYDWIHSLQNKLFRPNLKAVIEFIQVSTFGQVDEDIIFDFEPLWQMDDVQLATVQKTKADTHQVYSDLGAVDADEVRQSVAADEGSPYHGLDLNGPAPGPPEPPAIEGDPMGEKPDAGDE